MEGDEPCDLLNAKACYLKAMSDSSLRNGVFQSLSDFFSSKNKNNYIYTQILCEKKKRWAMYIKSSKLLFQQAVAPTQNAEQ